MPPGACCCLSPMAGAGARLIPNHPGLGFALRRDLGFFFFFLSPKSVSGVSKSCWSKGPLLCLPCQGFCRLLCTEGGFSWG